MIEIFIEGEQLHGGSRSNQERGSVVGLCTVRTDLVVGPSGSQAEIAVKIKILFQAAGRKSGDASDSGLLEPCRRVKSKKEVVVDWLTLRWVVMS